MLRCDIVVLVYLCMVAEFSFRPHQMHEMRTIATSVPVAWCVCHALRRAKTAGRIEVLYPVPVETLWPPKRCIRCGS